MTETPCCLDSHPKIFCTIEASIFSLQAYFYMKLEISKTVPPILVVGQSLSSVSCRMTSKLFYKAENLKDHVTFRQVQQSFLWRCHMSSSGKSSFFPKWLANSIRRLFNVHLPLEIIDAASSRCVSVSWKVLSPKH